MSAGSEYLACHRCRCRNLPVCASVIYARVRAEPAAPAQVKYFYAMAAWYNGLQLTVTGAVAGIPVAQINITLTSATQTQIFLPPTWPPIQTIYVSTLGGVPGPYASIPSNQVGAHLPRVQASPASWLRRVAA